MGLFIQRSMLILPGNVPRFIEKAAERGADSILVDLEDAVPADQRQATRSSVAESVGLCGKNGAIVLVRVNNDPSIIYLDLKAAICSGLHGIFLPKVEEAQQVRELDSLILEQERNSGIVEESVKISIHVESPLGLLNLKEILSASKRVESVSLGVDDYCLELEVEPTVEAMELVHPFSVMVTVARALGVHPFGILGSVSDYTNLEAFETAAVRARRLGSVGGYCIHPSQVPILNRVFSPSPQEISQAKRIVEKFEQALEKGRASTSLDGLMLDPPIYKRAIRILEYDGAIQDMKPKGA
jgi:citrate lyase subunit beta/citryl-CoA lyase